MNMALLDQQSFSQQSQTVLTFEGSKLKIQEDSLFGTVFEA